MLLVSFASAKKPTAVAIRAVVMCCWLPAALNGYNHHIGTGNARVNYTGRLSGPAVRKMVLQTGAHVKGGDSGWIAVQLVCLWRNSGNMRND